MNSQWVKDLTDYNPSREGHWPAYVAGFNWSLSGRIWLSDNKPRVIKDCHREGLVYPCHRDLIDGVGKDETHYSGLYCWKGNDATLWLYPHCEQIFNHDMLTGLKSLIGIHKIHSQTKIYSNVWRNFIASLHKDEIVSLHPNRQAA